MEKHLTKRTVTIGFVAALLFFTVVSVFSYEKINHTLLTHAVSPVAHAQTNYVSYFGKTGHNALTLLQEKTSVEEDQSGLVISIQGRKADISKHEFWAFYINGKMATVGPSDYVTKDNDKIEWKIQTY